jgi:hypothetical protein
MEDSTIEMSNIPGLGRMPQPATVITAKSIANGKMKAPGNKQIANAIFGSCGIVAWIILFGLGMLIDSQPFRDSLKDEFSMYAFFMTVLTFTPTNIALLCIVSAFTGGCASLLVVSRAQKVIEVSKERDDDKIDSQIYMNENPFSSMLRGVLVFFAFLAGVFVTSSPAILKPTAESYTQAAGIVSMLAFIVGYDPTFFKTMIGLGQKLKGGA